MNSASLETGMAAATSHVDVVYHKIARRILPFVTLLFVVAWLDRVNVGFAKLQMQHDLGLSNAAFGFGAGIFFVGYLIFEVPSNLLLEKIGARKTMARITILWGLTTMATMFVKSATSFYILRFLLGGFEAGLYPGVILYLTYWFPARRRAQMVGFFMTSVPIAGILGGPIGGWIMGAWAALPATPTGNGCSFSKESPRSLSASSPCFFSMTSRARPVGSAQAEKRLVLADLQTEQPSGGRAQAFISRCGQNSAALASGTDLFLPRQRQPDARLLVADDHQGHGRTQRRHHRSAGIPALHRRRHRDDHCRPPFRPPSRATLSLRARNAGRRRRPGADRRAGASPVLSFLALILAVAGVLSAFAPFWQMPTMLLAGSAAAGGIALINSFGNLSGFVGPYLVGWLRDVTGTTATGLYAVAGIEILCTVLILLFVPRTKPASTNVREEIIHP